MSKKTPSTEGFPAGSRRDRPHAPDGWIVERRTDPPESGHVGRHRDDGFPAGDPNRDR